MAIQPYVQAGGFYRVCPGGGDGDRRCDRGAVHGRTDVHSRRRGSRTCAAATTAADGETHGFVLQQVVPTGGVDVNRVRAVGESEVGVEEGVMRKGVRELLLGLVAVDPDFDFAHRGLAGGANAEVDGTGRRGRTGTTDVDTERRIGRSAGREVAAAGVQQNGEVVGVTASAVVGVLADGEVRFGIEIGAQGKRGTELCTGGVNVLLRLIGAIGITRKDGDEFA